ncbi:transmembrane channel-like protein 7 [Periophthalmus magnuspinnatus]|uniref:transmembrane channel-like protein 7 n=1 Tax=Periophthalmus magnuspinnatus TaxID=409849 RepID=UPI00145B9E91|nr:transmembrane channel-like protein 7 [Periophthalmus magnuspinnatus]
MRHLMRSDIQNFLCFFTEIPKMDEHNSVSLMRLPSDESTHSTLSSDSELYRAQILDLLPSSQMGHLNKNNNIYLDNGSQVTTQPIRNLLLGLQAKRTVRDMRKMQKSRIGVWESWRRSQSIYRRRVREQTGEALRGLVPWQRTLHSIEGRFGVGVKAYFVFLRYLVYLNLLLCALVGGLILGPTAFYGKGMRSDFLKFGANDSVLDFFLGTGYLERSPVFYGFYSRGSLEFPCLNTPLLYLYAVLSIYFISLLLVVRRTVVGYKHTWILMKRLNTFVSYKIFCGWDHTIRDPSAAALKHNFIRNDLKLFFDEQNFTLREAQRTLGQWIRLYLLRFLLNLIVLALLSGAFFFIYFATKMSQSENNERGHWLFSLFLQYLPPMTITTVNMVLPHIFRKISAFEDNSFTTQVNATLVRSIFLKLGSLGIYLFFTFTTNHDQCWENQIGREMYKLCIFNFLTTFSFAFFINYPRKLVQEKYPSSLVARLSGKQQFLIPFNVLDLVYAQTVSWVGVYYCPLLPLIGTVALTATFYIKKFTLLRCCVAEQRMFRASSSSVLFHFMLLLGLAIAGVTLAFNLLRSSLMPSCGPFGNGRSVLNVTGACMQTLPSPVQTTIHFLSSAAFALPLLMTQVIMLTFYVSRRRANNKTIERLKQMLVTTSADKRFLVKEHATILRCRKRHPDSAQTDKSRSLNQEPGSPPPTQDVPEGIL